MIIYVKNISHYFVIEVGTNPMNQIISTHKHQQKPVEDILDFCTTMGSRLIESGANLERVQLAVERISRAYGLTDVSLILLSTNISLSARDQTGYYAIRQKSIPPLKIQVNRLQSLNSLCYEVARQTPSPKDLKGLLDNASRVKEYSDLQILLGRLCAMSCLCLMFGGQIREVFCALIVITVMHFTLHLLEFLGIDKILSNTLVMWIATTVICLLTGLGIASNKPALIITATMLVIPGVPLVNAMRNILCGNEMNGILQTARATVETFALAMGIYLSILMFAKGTGIDGPVVSSLTNPFILITLSFIASCGFGVIFGLKTRDLWMAGLGGMLTRITMLLMAPVSSRLFIVTVSAFVASVYAEVLATIHKKPSTYYIYPTIIPLIPGDLFFYALMGVYNHDPMMVRMNGLNCALTLASMSIGFVLSFVAAHYIRMMNYKPVNSHHRK